MLSMMPEITVMSPIVTSDTKLVLDKNRKEINTFSERRDTKMDKSPAKDDYEEVFIEGFSILSFETLDDLMTYSSKCQEKIDLESERKLRKKRRHMSMKRSQLDTSKNNGASETESQRNGSESSPKIKRMKLEVCAQDEPLKKTFETVQQPRKRRRFCQRSISVPPKNKEKIIVNRRSKSVSDAKALLTRRTCQAVPHVTRQTSANISPLKNRLPDPQRPRPFVPHPVRGSGGPDDMEASRKLLSHPEMIQSLSKLLKISVDEVRNLVRNPVFLQLYRISLSALSKQHQRSPQANQKHFGQDQSDPRYQFHPGSTPISSTLSSPLKSPYPPNMIKRMNFNNSPRPSHPTHAIHSSNYFKPKAPLIHIQNGVKAPLDIVTTVHQVPRSIIAKNEVTEPMAPLNLSAKKPRVSTPDRIYDMDPKNPKPTNMMNTSEYQAFLRNMRKLPEFDPRLNGLNRYPSMPHRNVTNPTANGHRSIIDPIKILQSSSPLRFNDNQLKSMSPLDSPRIPLYDNGKPAIRLPANFNHPSKNGHFSNPSQSPSVKKNSIKWCDAHVRIAYNIHFANTLQKNMSLGQTRLNGAHGVMGNPNSIQSSSEVKTTYPIPHSSSHAFQGSSALNSSPLNSRQLPGIVSTGGRLNPTANSMFNGYRSNQQGFTNSSTPKDSSHSMQKSHPNFPGPMMPQSRQFNSPRPSPHPPKSPAPQSSASMEQYYQIFQEFCKNFAQQQNQLQRNPDQGPSSRGNGQKPPPPPYPNVQQNSPSFYS